MSKRELPVITVSFQTIGKNLDDVIKLLQSNKNDDINYYYDFHSHRLYSDTVTEESAYNEVYNMTREEYRKQLKESYEEHKRIKKERMMKLKKSFIESIKEIKKELEEDKKKIFDKARTIIPEDKMYIFDEVYNKAFLFPSSDSYVYLDLLELLNREDYSLDEAKKIFKRIQPHIVLIDCLLLKSIKELSKYGYVLFDELYDEEKEKEAQRIRDEFVARFSKPIINKKWNSTEDELLTTYDRHKELTYQLSKENNNKETR